MIQFFGNREIHDLLFRVLFSSIFMGLGMEHLFSDQLIQELMPPWTPYPRLASIACGILLVSGATCIILGWKVREAAIALGTFPVAVTILVHGPGLGSFPADLPQDWEWLWTVLQRSNFVKNMCLLGVCMHMLHYRPGIYSLTHYLLKKQREPT